MPKVKEKNARRTKILSYIEEKRNMGVTDAEMCSSLRLPINIITGRRNDLMRLGHVYYSGKKRLNPKTGKMVKVWKIVFQAKKKKAQV